MKGRRRLWRSGRRVWLQVAAGRSRRWRPPTSALAATSAGRRTSQRPVPCLRDSRGVTVLAGRGLSKDFTDRTAVRLKFGVDAITAASDSCVRCHQQGRVTAAGVQRQSVRKYGDTKREVGGGFGREKSITRQHSRHR